MLEYLLSTKGSDRNIIQKTNKSNLIFSLIFLLLRLSICTYIHILYIYILKKKRNEKEKKTSISNCSNASRYKRRKKDEFGCVTAINVNKNM